MAISGCSKKRSSSYGVKCHTAKIHVNSTCSQYKYDMNII